MILEHADLLHIIKVDVDQDKINKLDKRVTRAHMLIFGNMPEDNVLTCYLKGIN